MGVYDTVMVPCPNCGTKEGFQSKSGPCKLATYELMKAPAAVLENVNRHAPVQCSGCGTYYQVQLTIAALGSVKVDVE